MYQELGPDYIYAHPERLHQGRRSAIGTSISPATRSRWASRSPTGQVEYTDGTPHDAQAIRQGRRGFPVLGGGADLEQRKRVGARVMLFLIVLAGLLYFTKKRVWSDVAH